ncbi:MAG: cell division protein FtsZ [Oscillospiraceae bacterium]
MAFDLDKNTEYENEEDVKIVVFGVGGGGGNTVATMVDKKVTGVHYVIANTNTRDLDNKDKTKIQTIHLAKKKNEEREERLRGRRRVKVRGAGGHPGVGEECAKDTLDEIIAQIEDADMLFVAASMGGGTGTGAAPVVAQAAKEMGILTVGVATKPFNYEGSARMNVALEGIQKMRENVDALIVIDDESVFKLKEYAGTSMNDMFKAVDDILCKAVMGIIDLIDADGFINVDFADVCSTLEDAGLAHMAIGHGKGENARKNAVDEVLHSPLLATSIDGAKRGLININIPKSFDVSEYQQLATDISSRFNKDAFFKVGVVFDEELADDEISIIAIATDFDEDVVDRVINNQTPASVDIGFPSFPTQGAVDVNAFQSFGSMSRDSETNAFMNAINNSKGR